MDATKIVVIVLTLIAFGLLVMVEMRSRKNQRLEKEGKVRKLEEGS